MLDMAKSTSHIKTPSPVAVAAKLRSGAGVHNDQKRKVDQRQVRRTGRHGRDSYRDPRNW
jgi:hypothetical protein